MLAALSACTTGTPAAAFGAQRTPTPEVVLLPIPSASPSSPTGGGAAATFGKKGEAALPDPEVTKGAVFADVSKDVLCDPHYSLGIRQPRFNDKVAAFEAYGISIRQRDEYQVDHLVPVSLGGSNALANLWPQPYGAPGAVQKDELEARLRLLVCSGRVDLAAAQQAIATDWLTALDTYGAMPLPSGAGPAPSPVAPPPDPFEVTNGGPCPKSGDVGLTASKGIRFTCVQSEDGTLHWAKRY